MENSQPLIKKIDNQSEKNILKSFDSKQAKWPIKTFFIFLIISLVAGIFTGFLFNQLSNSQSTKKIANSLKTNTDKKAGIVDKKTFKDHAEGILKEGGIDGEGQYHLQRPGGESQNVYLTSTTVDMSKFVNKKVRVWGQTFQGEKAGWLMDVGFIEVIN